MKRGTDSSSSKTQMKLGPSITDLTSSILVEILLQLPVKSIIMCKSVCKNLYGLISDPEFVKLHLGQAKTCAFIRGLESWKFSRSLYFLEPEDDRGIYSGYCHCRARKQRCENCLMDEELKFKLKIPLRNVQVMLDWVANSDTGALFSIGTAMTHKRSIRMKSGKDHCYDIANSSNGFICLYSRDTLVGSVCICNPVTGEFTYPPMGHGHGNYWVQFREFGFGFSPKHNQFKIIRMSTCSKKNPVTGFFQGNYASVVEIHTLGTDSWRNLDISGFDIPAICSPSYLDGALYWTREKDKKYHMASFDFDNEQFCSFPILPSPETFFCQLGLLVQGDSPFVYTTSGYSDFDIWVLNKCGDSFTCTQLFSIDLTEVHDPPMWFPYELVCCLRNEAVVLFGGPRDEFIYYDRSKGLRFKLPKFQGLRSKSNYFKVIGFTPSFVSLKDVVMAGSNVEVLNVYSGCGKLKLLEETYPLLLGKARK